MHKSTVTRSLSCSEKKIRVRLEYIVFDMHYQHVGVCNDLQSRYLVNPKKYNLNYFLYQFVLKLHKKHVIYAYICMLK